MSTTKHPLPIQTKKYAIHLSPVKMFLLCLVAIVFSPLILSAALFTEFINLVALLFVDKRKYTTATGRRISLDDSIEWHG